MCLWEKLQAAFYCFSGECIIYSFIYSFICIPPLSFVRVFRRQVTNHLQKLANVSINYISVMYFRDVCIMLHCCVPSCNVLSCLFLFCFTLMTILKSVTLLSVILWCIVHSVWTEIKREISLFQTQAEVQLHKQVGLKICSVLIRLHVLATH